VVWPTGPAAKGHAAIRAEWEKAYKDLDDPYLDFKPTHIEVSGDGDMAVDFGVVYFAPNRNPTIWKTSLNISWSGNVSTATGKCSTIAGTIIR
jgi:hypothetical protein